MKKIEFDDDLYIKLQGMIYRLAAHHAHGDDHLKEDLIQEGWIGVNLACEEFVYGKGATLKTYAYIKARDYMMRYIRSKSSIVHVPKWRKERAQLVELDGIDTPSVDWTEHIDLHESLSTLDDLTRTLVVENIGNGVTILALAAVHGINRYKVGRMIQKGIKQLKESML